jgi:hypothetical protein
VVVALLYRVCVERRWRHKDARGQVKPGWWAGTGSNTPAALVGERHTQRGWVRGRNGYHELQRPRADRMGCNWSGLRRMLRLVEL